MAREPYPYDELIMEPAEPWPYSYDELVVMGPQPEEPFPFSDDGWWRQLEEDGGQPWSQFQEEEFLELFPIPLPDDDDPAAAAAAAGQPTPPCKI
ncbi:hypothetical protein TRIUR3_18449 [Triticum urartu]|uniref:Uncharacterized protein n=1 Tax=Triticum urartu TaxID=4572 RepID=M8AIP6_TRIUA|nr:hypothetical protein TRIUR3_18449 [Triticum urartu]